MLSHTTGAQVVHSEKGGAMYPTITRIDVEGTYTYKFNDSGLRGERKCNRYIVCLGKSLCDTCTKQVPCEYCGHGCRLCRIFRDCSATWGGDDIVTKCSGYNREEVI